MGAFAIPPKPPYTVTAYRDRRAVERGLFS